MPLLGGPVRCSPSAWPARISTAKHRTDVLGHGRRWQMRHASTSRGNNGKQPPATTHRLPSAEHSDSIVSQVRESMRLVAQPLVIVTTLTGSETGPSTSEPLLGLVASSFNVVSMAAPGGPIVSFNLKLPSRTFSAISASGHFEISFPWSADICRSMLGIGPKTQGSWKKNTNNREPFSKDFKCLPQAFESQTESLLHLQRTFAYRCKWLQDQSIIVADHIIMLGQVKEFVVGEKTGKRGISVDKLPINYRSSQFLRLRTHSSMEGFFRFSVTEELL